MAQSPAVVITATTGVVQRLAAMLTFYPLIVAPFSPQAATIVHAAFPCVVSKNKNSINFMYLPIRQVVENCGGVAVLFFFNSYIK